MLSHHAHRTAVATKTDRRHKSRYGLTLVEMMVSVVLTLLVVFALVRVFESLGNSVTDGRATIELSGQLRSAAQTLRDDLRGLTVTTLPPRAPDQGEGYLELIDGPSTDSQHFVQLAPGGIPDQVQMVRLSDASQNFIDQSIPADGYLDGNADAYDTSVGDVDDVLAFTTRSESQPFTGVITDPRIQFKHVGGSLIPDPRAPTLILESTEAEVVWWLQVERNLATDGTQTPVVELLQGMSLTEQIANATTNLGNGNEAQRVLTAQRYPNFTDATLGTPVRSLHRRALLVRPDLDLSAVVLNGVDELAAFLSNNDISVRVLRQGNTNVYHVAANTLADLSIRQNRSCRPIKYWEGLASRDFPRTTRFSDQRSSEMLDAQSFLLRHVAMKDMVLDVNKDGTPDAVMLRKNKDVVLTDALGFDIQVWDPQALKRVATDGTVVLPSDPSYVNAPIEGTRGAYVDLGFAVQPKQMSNLPLQYHGLFGGFPNKKSGLPIVVGTNTGDSQGTATYCTWSSQYEHDGIDQDKDGVVDQGTNCLDDNGFFGPDDPSEVETIAPYPHPLRGLKVSLRTMDSGTRQVRQTSVIHDFLPE